MFLSAPTISELENPISSHPASILLNLYRILSGNRKLPLMFNLEINTYKLSFYLSKTDKYQETCVLIVRTTGAHFRPPSLHVPPKLRPL